MSVELLHTQPLRTQSLRTHTAWRIAPHLGIALRASLPAAMLALALLSMLDGDVARWLALAT